MAKEKMYSTARNPWARRLREIDKEQSVYGGSQGSSPGSWADDEFEDDMDLIIELAKPHKYNDVLPGPDGNYYPVGPQTQQKRRKKRKKKR